MPGTRAACLVLALALAPLPAAAGNCIGTVTGLSPTYNPATGSGFLAVRDGPSRDANQIGELFNGDQVDVGKEEGPWVYVLAEKVEGWVHRNWLRVRCP